MASGAFTATVSAITNAFGDPTRRGIYLFARERAEGVTASQVAEQFGLHPNVARHHLARLAPAPPRPPSRRRLPRSRRRTSRRRRCRAAVEALSVGGGCQDRRCRAQRRP